MLAKGDGHFDCALNKSDVASTALSQLIIFI